MIREEEIGGEMALVAYLTLDFEFVDPEDAEMIKIMYDDGRVVFAFAAPEEEQ